MKFNEIQKMATGLGINAYRQKKIDLIRKIQEKEGNIACYGTERVDYCNEEICLWRNDCIALYQKKLTEHLP